MAIGNFVTIWSARKGGEGMLDEDSVRRLRCPITLGKLTPADDALLFRVNRLIDSGAVSTRGGQPQLQRLRQALVTDDGRRLYPIEDGIVCLLADGAIELDFVRDAPP